MKKLYFVKLRKLLMHCSFYKSCIEQICRQSSNREEPTGWEREEDSRQNLAEDGIVCPTPTEAFKLFALIDRRNENGSDVESKLSV